MIDLQDAYRRMKAIRDLELQIAFEYSKGEMRCPMHLSVGQEAPAVAAALAKQPGDWAFSNHRCHAHYLAWSGYPQALLDELKGLPTGCAKGWGGSMHLVDESVGFMGTSAIVGSGLSVAVGAAFAFKQQRRPNVVWAFVGDAAPETGQFWEAMLFASLHHLPLVVVLEDNGYATQTPKAQRQPAGILGAVASLGLWAEHADDQEDTFSSIQKLLKEARNEVPALVRIKTYRWLEHVGPNPDWDLGYRSRTEVEAAMAKDPLKWLEALCATARP